MWRRTWGDHPRCRLAGDRLRPGVAIGAPFMALATARLPRKAALVTLMGVFIVGNLLCAVAADYDL